MRNFLLTSAALLGLATAAQAQDVRFSTLANSPDLRPHMLAQTKNAEPWLRALVEEGGVEGPAKTVDIDGQPYTFATTCRPHMCADYGLAVLTGPQKDVHLFVYGGEVKDAGLADMPAAIHGRFLTEIAKF